MEFDNLRGPRHIRWHISQATGVSPAQLEIRSAIHPWVTDAFNNSRTLGELCDICAQVRNDHLKVYAVPARGRSRLLGTITIERAGSLRPQLLPPYDSNDFAFVESVQDFDESQTYFQPVQSRLRPPFSRSSYEIILHLPFVPSIVLRHTISHNTVISDVHAWFAEQFDTYNTMSVTEESNQLHFLEGHAMPSDQCYSLLDIRPNQPIYIVSRQSLRYSTTTGYTRLFLGHYFVRRVIDANVVDSLFQSTVDLFSNDDADTSTDTFNGNEFPNVHSAAQLSPNPSLDRHANDTVTDTQDRREPTTTSPEDSVEQYRINMWMAGSMIAKEKNSSSLMADSGCEISVLTSDKYFVSRQYCRTEILTAKTACSIISPMRGIVEIPVRDHRGRIVMLTLSPCLMTPECDIPLMSIATLIAKGYHVKYTPQFSGIVVDADIFIPFIRIRNMWFLQIVDHVSPTAIALKLNRPDVKTVIQWHLTCAHSPARIMQETSKISIGMPSLPISDHPPCPICIQAKMRARNCPPPSTTRTSAPGDLIHYDIYFLDKVTLVSQFLDDYSSHKWAYVHRYRNADVMKLIFNQFFAQIQSIRLKDTGLHVRVAKLRSDNGKEFTGAQITELCADLQIHREFTCAYTPEQNGKAERGNGSTSTMNRSLLLWQSRTRKWVYVYNEQITVTHLAHS
jgi:hypothetical protein